MSKDFATRFQDVLGTITAESDAVARKVKAVYDGMSRDRQRALSNSLSQGHRVWASNEEKTQRRAEMRAILLLRKMYDGLEREEIKAGLDQKSNAQITYIFKEVVRFASRRSPASDLDLNHMRGRMELIGSLSNVNRGDPWFDLQFRIFDHFSGRLGRVPADRRAVFRAALSTAGIINWSPNEPKTNGLPDGDRRFDQFARASDLCRSPNGETITLNCWEAVLFWAYKAGHLTVPKCKALYAAGPPGNMENLFGKDPARKNPRASALEPGDILTYVNGGVLNHVAMYVGLYNAIPYLFHCLSTDAAVVGMNFSCPHFLSLVEMDVFYVSMYGPADCYANRPFYLHGAPTHAYFLSL
jgi:hypothetical protein